VTKSARFRFSLATMLLVVTWFAVVLGIMTRSRVQLMRLPGRDLEIVITYYGWPWVCAVDERWRIGPPGSYLSFSYWRLVGDAVVGLLLVSVLTWSSRYLWRRAKHGFRRPQSPPVSETMARYYYAGPWYWRLVGDAVIGVLLVVVLAWGSTFLVRCVKDVLGRVESAPVVTTMGE
jgi:hypothetical protein